MDVSGDNSSSSLHSLPEHSEPFSSCLAQQFAKTEAPASCDSFLQPLHNPFLAPDFGDTPALQECWDSTHPAHAHLLAPSGPVPGGSINVDRLSARRLHKADREKLRRDKLNEQFTELASALDPDRPKNDKATILGESVQVVKDLRDEVKRLKTEHSSLLDEFRDLTQEKNELREEKAALKNETEQLQNQIQQRLRATSPWMAMDPSMMMNAIAFPYPVPVQQPTSAPQTDSQVMSAPPRPLLTPAPFMPLAPPLTAFPVHPNLQAFSVYGNRPPDVGGNPYMQYPAFTRQPMSSHSHVERPYAQYPTTVQPIPGFVVQIAPNPGSDSQPSSRSSSAYKACVPGIPVMPVSPNHGQSKAGSHHPSTSESSSQHTPSESKKDNHGVTERHACSIESIGPSTSLASHTAASSDLKSCDSGLCPVNYASLHETEKNSDVSAAQDAIMNKVDENAIMDKVDENALKIQINIDNDCEYDSSLRPPAA